MLLFFYHLSSQCFGFLTFCAYSYVSYSWCRLSLDVSWVVRRWMIWTSSWLQGYYRFSWITIRRSCRCLCTCAMLWKITSVTSNHWWVLTNLLCCLISLWNLDTCFSRILWWIESSKRTAFIRKKKNCNILNLFTVMFDQMNPWFKKVLIF